MATREHTGLGRARRFGLEIGGACLALAVWFSIRNSHHVARSPLLALGVTLLMVALVRPVALAGIAAAWLSFGERVASVTTPLFVTVLYLLVVTPIGIARRRFSRSPIRRQPGAPTYWVRRAPSTPEARRSAMEHQF